MECMDQLIKNGKKGEKAGENGKNPKKKVNIGGKEGETLTFIYHARIDMSRFAAWFTENKLCLRSEEKEGKRGNLGAGRVKEGGNGEKRERKNII